MWFESVTLRAAAPLLEDLETFYGDVLGVERGGGGLRFGETGLSFEAGAGEPFYHFALLVPGDRFGEVLEWARERVELLPDPDTDDVVFDFEEWRAGACYFADPAGNIVELIAHEGLGENGRSGAFRAEELLGFSELGLVGEPAEVARELARIDLHVWAGEVDEPGRLAFAGDKGRTLILSPVGRGWLPTGRPAEPHRVDCTIHGAGVGEIVTNGHRIRATG